MRVWHKRRSDAHRLIYHLPKPGPDGRTQLILSPLELIERIAALVPPPRQHGNRYYGVLPPNAPLRVAVTALLPEAVAAQPSPPVKTSGDKPAETPHRSPVRYLWATLLAGIYEAIPLGSRTLQELGEKNPVAVFVKGVSTSLSQSLYIVVDHLPRWGISSSRKVLILVRSVNFLQRSSVIHTTHCVGSVTHSQILHLVPTRAKWTPPFR